MKRFYVITIFGILTFICVNSLNPSHMLKKFTATDKRIRSHGYPAKSYFVETDDGYILNLFRIPYSYKLGYKNVTSPAILLQHGFLSNSDCWLSTGPDNALAYLLSDAGFDVWLGNARGNIYSRNNTKISPNNPKFWRFDWHEIGKMDIPTMIDFIIDVTGKQNVHYVGHSQGTTSYFVLMSERPEYNMKIKSAHLLAPCAFFEHTTSHILKNLSLLIGNPGSIWYKLLVDMEVSPQNNLIVNISNTACATEPALRKLCKNMWLFLAGDGYTNTNLTALQILLETHPGGSSSNQGIHYLQLSDYNKGRFCQMDYGAKKNMQIYGQYTTADYNIDNINAPTYLYSSANDGLCTSKDVDTLVANIPHLAGDYRVPLKSFNHLDFVIGANLKELVNGPLIQNIFKHEIHF